MPAVLIPFENAVTPVEKSGSWTLVQIARPGTGPVPFGILLADEADALLCRFRDRDCLGELSEQEEDFLAALPDHFALLGRESGARAVILDLEDSASNFLRVTDSAVISWRGSVEAVLGRLFDDYVLEKPRVRFVTHLPFYGLRAAATKFGDLVEAKTGDDASGWLRAPEKLRLTKELFVAQVVGRSMEPRIPDGSYCVFRLNVTGSRQGRLVLVEMKDETDLALRFSVKRYAVHADRDEQAERTAKIWLEPLNPQFEAFALDSDRCRIIAEFVQVLGAPDDLEVEDVPAGEGDFGF